VVLVGVVWLVAHNADELRSAVDDVGLAALSISFVLAVLGNVAIGQIWLTLLRGLEIPVAWLEGSGVFFVTQLGKYIPGSVWPVMAQMELGRRWGAPRRTMLSANILLLALVAANFGRALLGLDHPGFLLETLVFVARWGAALALLSTAVWLLLRFGPAHPAPHRWVSFGSALCVIAWVGTSLVFALYVTQIADYNSIFGSLATVFVLLTYLYLSAASFLIGAEVDAAAPQSADS